jgi:Rrf2 family protein
LCRAGFVASRRGQSGGFEMLPAGREASIRTVIEAIEGPICLNLCLTTGVVCNRMSFCPAHPIWEKAQEAMLEVLSAATVADLALETVAPRAPFSAGRH